MFALSVFFAVFSSTPKVKGGHIVVRMSAVRFAEFQAKWEEMGGAQCARQGFFYYERMGLLDAWG